MSLIKKMLSISGIEYHIKICGPYNNEMYLSVKTDDFKVKEIQEFCDHVLMAPFTAYVEKMK